jgi:hypothetical protein
MIHRKRIPALARTSLAVLIGTALEACSAGTHPAPVAQASDPPTRGEASGDSASAVPEIVVSAPRMSSPAMAQENSSRPPAKRRGS